MREPVIIAEWRRNSREVVRVVLDAFNGNDTVDIRTWFNAGDGKVQPGKSGITLGIKHIPALSAAIAKAESEARSRGQID